MGYLLLLFILTAAFNEVFPLRYCLLELHEYLDNLLLDTRLGSLVDELQTDAPQFLEFREQCAPFDHELALHSYPLEQEVQHLHMIG